MKSFPDQHPHEIDRADLDLLRAFGENMHAVLWHADREYVLVPLKGESRSQEALPGVRLTTEETRYAHVSIEMLREIAEAAARVAAVFQSPEFALPDCAGRIRVRPKEYVDSKGAADRLQHPSSPRPG